MAPYVRWLSGILLVTAVFTLALAGCNVAATESPTSETRETLPAVTPTETRTADKEGSLVSPGEAPSTPIIVGLSMSKAPKLHEEVEVTLKVQAYSDAPGTTADIELPPGVRLVSGVPHWEGEVKPGRPVQLTVRVVFTREGEYTIRGRALRPVNPDMTWGDADYVYLTVRQDSGFFGFESGGDSQLTASPVPDESR